MWRGTAVPTLGFFRKVQDESRLTYVIAMAESPQQLTVLFFMLSRDSRAKGPKRSETEWANRLGDYSSLEAHSSSLIFLASLPPPWISEHPSLFEQAKFSLGLHWLQLKGLCHTTLLKVLQGNWKSSKEIATWNQKMRIIHTTSSPFSCHPQPPSPAKQSQILHWKESLPFVPYRLEVFLYLNENLSN